MVINHFLKNFNVSAKKLSIANDLTQWLAYYKIVGSLPSRSVLSRDPKTTNHPVKVYCDCSIDKLLHLSGWIKEDLIKEVKPGLVLEDRKIFKEKSRKTDIGFGEKMEQNHRGWKTEAVLLSAGFGQNHMGRLFINLTRPQYRPTKFKSLRLSLSNYIYFSFQRCFC